MRLGFIISLTLHVLLMGWLVLNLHQTPEIVVPEVVPISVAIVTPSEFTRMKQGDQYTKNLESKAADKPVEDDNTKEAAKPKAAPPPAATPPPPPVEETPPPPPEPPKPEPAKEEPPKPEPPKPDEIAKKIAEPPPPEPEGPTPDEQAALAAKLDAEKKAEEAKAKADAAAKAAELKKKQDDLKKKLAEDKKKKEEAEKKRLAALEAKKAKFDPAALEKMLEQQPDEGKKTALLDKSKKPVGGKASGDSHTATNLGPSAGTKEGRDNVLSAREADMLASLIDSKLRGCWRLPAGGGGAQTPIVTLSWRLKPDGTLDGEPQVLQPQNNPLFAVAAEAAVRAVKSCVPFQLPPDKYANWKNITSWAFDPSKML